MPFINRYDGREVETVDSADTAKEARRLASEYRLADPSADYRVSSRATREWREAEREAARPDRVTLAKPVPAFRDAMFGLVPCVVTGGRTDNTGALTLSVRYTGRAARWPEGYRAGDTDDARPHRIIPRGAVRGQNISPYSWPREAAELAELRGIRS